MLAARGACGLCGLRDSRIDATTEGAEEDQSGSEKLSGNAVA